MWLFLLLACTGGSPLDPGDDGDDGGDGGSDPGSSPPVPWTVWRDAEGRDVTSASPEELCGEARFLGTIGGGAVCLDPDVGAVLSPISTPEGDTWPETLDDEAQVCPQGWDYKGGNGWTATCVRADPGVGVLLYYDVDGRYYEDLPQRGDVCPDGTTWVGGGVYGAPICLFDGWYAFTSVYQGVEGTTSDQDPDQCAPGWDLVGTWYGWSQCMRDEGTVVALYQSPDGATWDPEEPDRICPAGWEYVGSYYGYSACWTSERRSVVSLYSGADGTEFTDVEHGADLCPEGWEYLGQAGGSSVCVE